MVNNSIHVASMRFVTPMWLLIVVMCSKKFSLFYYLAQQLKNKHVFYFVTTQFTMPYFELKSVPSKNN